MCGFMGTWTSLLALILIPEQVLYNLSKVILQNISSSINPTIHPSLTTLRA